MRQLNLNKKEDISSKLHHPVNRNTGIMPQTGNFSPFDELAAEYDAWFDKEGKFIFLIETQAFRTVLSALPKPWIEIGVGSGRFAQALGIETGIDPSTKLIEIAKNRGINAFIARGQDHIFETESFGTVFLIVTLCFLDEPLSVLKETYNILMPNGKIVLGLVLRESPWGEFYQQKKEEGHRFYKYATFYNRDEVVKLLAQAGFVIERLISTLFQKPERVHNVENPKEGYLVNAGFTIIVAGKRAN